LEVCCAPVSDRLFSSLFPLSFHPLSSYAKLLMGEYMTLPPENERRWHPVTKFKLP
jgi:hypothetical protein